MQLRVPFFQTAPTIDGEWNKFPWEYIPAQPISHHMGPFPRHFPKTEFKIGHDHSALYLIFQVYDRYIRATAQKCQDPVFQDSCVEFFFSPGPDVKRGYFNLEMNCGGVFLFHFQTGPRLDVIPVSLEKCQTIQVAHTLPRAMAHELPGPRIWRVEYRLPFHILNDYINFQNPKPGAKWRANFYKCADLSSHPHWLTWAPVKHPGPQFHLPEYFGTMLFED